MLSSPPLSVESRQLLERLQRQVRCLEGVKPPENEERISTGCPELDALFPDGGLRRGSVVEWLSPGSGSGASFLALLAARAASTNGGAIVICERKEAFYPPALAGMNVDLNRVILIRAKDLADQRWAIDQALRSPAVAAVWAKLEKIDDKTSRRFQLAAETGGAVGLLVRPTKVRGQPTWAEVRLAVRTGVRGQGSGVIGERRSHLPLPVGEGRGEGLKESRKSLSLGRYPHPNPLPQGEGTSRRWQVELVQARGPTARQSAVIEWDEVAGVLRAVSRHHETHPVSVVRRA